MGLAHLCHCASPMVADIAADKKKMVNMELDMVANMEADKTADKVADVFKTKCITPEMF